VTQITPLKSPTEIDHYQIQRVIDIYVNPTDEDLGRLAAALRRPGLRWLMGSRDPALRLAGPVRCVRCKRSVCPSCRRIM